MGNDRAIKIVSVCALLIAVVGLTLGFAAYTNTLTIKSMATVTPESTDFDMELTPEEGTGTTIEPETTGGATATDAEIDTSVPGEAVIKNLQANFTAPGQSVTYSLTVNGSESYISYLRSIVFGTKTCTKAANSTVTDSLMNSACENITVTVQAGDDTYTATNESITDHSIAKGGSENILVTISYGGSVYADGAFNVDFGDIVLTYTSAPTTATAGA